MFDIENKKIVDLSIMMDPTDQDHAKSAQWGKVRGTIPPAMRPEDLIKVEPYIYKCDQTMCEWLTMWSHAGTHVEIALHSREAGAHDIPEEMNYSIGEIPLEDLCGLGYAVDLTSIGNKKKEKDSKKLKGFLERHAISGPEILPEDIEEWELNNDAHIEKGDILFFHTRLKKPVIPFLLEETCMYLVLERKIKTIGIDNNSMAYGSMGHDFLHKHKIPVIESLTNLGKLGSQRAYFVISSLPIMGIGASPSRIIAYVDEIIDI